MQSAQLRAPLELCQRLRPAFGAVVGVELLTKWASPAQAMRKLRRDPGILPNESAINTGGERPEGELTCPPLPRKLPIFVAEIEVVIIRIIFFIDFTIIF